MTADNPADAGPDGRMGGDDGPAGWAGAEGDAMGIQLGMVVLDVRDIERSIAFYRLVGLEMPDPPAERRVTQLRMDSGVTLLLIEGFAERNDPSWVRPGADTYQQILEFVADGDGEVDDLWAAVTGAGFHGRKEPSRGGGIYSALVDDPDGNVVMISSDPNARA
jgi:predicted lactoylglutathione lyase